MKRPTEQQIETAYLWLRVNDGDNGEAEACAAVADWIEYLRDEAMIKAAARKAGVSAASFRRRLAAKAWVQP